MTFYALLVTNVLTWPTIALLTCLLCRRHGVLLWLGGLILVPSGLLSIPLWRSIWKAYVGIDPGKHGLEGIHVVASMLFPPLVSSIILLVGGLVRWDRVRSERRRVPAP